jgi:hypothetical protein
MTCKRTRATALLERPVLVWSVRVFVLSEHMWDVVPGVDTEVARDRRTWAATAAPARRRSSAGADSEQTKAGDDQPTDGGDESSADHGSFAGGDGHLGGADFSRRCGAGPRTSGHRCARGPDRETLRWCNRHLRDRSRAWNLRVERRPGRWAWVELSRGASRIGWRERCVGHLTSSLRCRSNEVIS